MEQRWLARSQDETGALPTGTLKVALWAMAREQREARDAIKRSDDFSIELIDRDGAEAAGALRIRSGARVSSVRLQSIILDTDIIAVIIIAVTGALPGRGGGPYDRSARGAIGAARQRARSPSGRCTADNCPRRAAEQGTTDGSITLCIAAATG